MRRHALYKKVRQVKTTKALGLPVIVFTDFQTTPRSTKAWITPEGDFVKLTTYHYEWFRDPAQAARWGVAFGREGPTRLAALRVGFVRVNYERQGGILTFESMRLDSLLRVRFDEVVEANAEAIDLVRLHIVDSEGWAIQVVASSLLDLRRRGQPVTRETLGPWSDFPETRLPPRPLSQRSNKTKQRSPFPPLSP